VKGAVRALKPGTASWVKPQSAVWQRHGLRVRVNPEVGLDGSERPGLIKLYFKGETLSKRRVDSILYLMDTTVGRGKFNVSVLDTRGGRLISYTGANKRLGLLLTSDAAAFMSIWNALSGGPSPT
jgi:hypothetical protein